MPMINDKSQIHNLTTYGGTCTSGKVHVYFSFVHIVHVHVM